MAKIGLIITLGKREIQFLTEEIKNISELDTITDSLINDPTRKSFKEPRIGGELLLKDFEKYREITLYPLVQSAIDYAKEQNPDELRIVFISTDQDSLKDSNDVQKRKHYNSDSVNFAKLLVEKILPGQVNAKLSYVPIDGDILQLDLMFSAFRNSKAFNEYLEELNNECKKVILFTQGGIGGLNNALMLHSILFFEDKLQVLGLKEGETEAHEQKVTEQFLKMFQVKQAKKLIDRYDYAGVEALTMLPKEIIAVAKYADYRLNFNFEKAVTIEQASNNNISIFRNIGSIDELAKIQTNYSLEQERELLKELFWNSFIQYKQGAYVDYLLRTWRITESALRNLTETLIGVQSKDFRFKPHFFKDDLNKIMNDDSELKSYLEKEWKKESNQDKFTKSNPNLQIYLDLIKYYANTCKHEYFTESVKNDLKSKRKFFSDKCLKLANMRNNSIGAHKFDPVSKEHIEAVLKSDIETFNSEYTKLLNAGTNPFDEINTWLLKELDNITY